MKTQFGGEHNDARLSRAKISEKGRRGEGRGGDDADDTTGGGVYLKGGSSRPTAEETSTTSASVQTTKFAKRLSLFGD